MSALSAPTLDHDKPVLLPAGQDLLRDAMGGRGTTVTALAVELGISRKHLSNLLNGHAPLIEPLLGRLAAALDVDPVLLRATLRPRRMPRRRSPHGCMKGTIEVHGDLTEPMADWEMLEA